MPRPKKVNPIDELLVSEEILVEETQEVLESEKPPTQVLIPFVIKKMVDTEDLEQTNNDIEVEQESILPENVNTKFSIYSHGEYVETVDDNSPELNKYLELNRLELDNRINELWQSPSDPNDLIFFNFGQQKMNYNSYNSYFTQNGFAPKEPIIKSWMEYYLNVHNPITPEEIAIQLKGSLQYSFIPIKS
jgi:hypothetical protein